MVILGIREQRQGVLVWETKQRWWSWHSHRDLLQVHMKRDLLETYPLLFVPFWSMNLNLSFSNFLGVPQMLVRGTLPSKHITGWKLCAKSSSPNDSKEFPETRVFGCLAPQACSCSLLCWWISFPFSPRGELTVFPLRCTPLPWGGGPWSLTSLSSPHPSCWAPDAAHSIMLKNAA